MLKFAEKICKHKKIILIIALLLLIPSFIGMHIFGILLPLYLFSIDKKVLALIIAYSILSVVFKSGVRIIIDIAVICAIFGLYYIISKKKYALLIVLTIFEKRKLKNK